MTHNERTNRLGFGRDTDFHAQIAGEADGVRGERGSMSLDFLQIGEMHAITDQSHHRPIFTLI